MEPFRVVTGLVAPLDRANVDTDAIIPKQFLKSVNRSGFGPNLFDAWRYLDAGKPGMDTSRRPLNPDFVLNEPRYQGATILLARRNFGCGSSREHAPWALGDFGFRAIIAPSYADIFYNNCFKNGLLPIVLAEAEVARLFDDAAAFPGFRLTIDLERQTVATADGGTCSATAIRSIIKKMVENELPMKPISDSKIAEILAEQGINVARRTVAKYRESMNIPPSNQRKSLV